MGMMMHRHDGAAALLAPGRIEGSRSAFTQLDAKPTPKQRHAATELLPLLFPDLL